MTTLEMVRQFKLLLDKTDSLTLDEFTPDEIVHYLNLGIEEFVKTRYREFEQTQKRIDDLRSLVIVGSYVAIAPYYNNNLRGYVLPVSLLDAPAFPYWFYLADQYRLFDAVCQKEFTGHIKTRQVDDLQEVEMNPFNRSTPLTPNKIITADGFTLFFGEQLSTTRYTSQLYRITYLRRPNTVSISPSVNCDLPAHTHTEIVNLSVRKALESIEHLSRYQTQINEITNHE